MVLQVHEEMNVAEALLDLHGEDEKQALAVAPAPEATEEEAAAEPVAVAAEPTVAAAELVVARAEPAAAAVAAEPADKTRPDLDATAANATAAAAMGAQIVETGSIFDGTRDQDRVMRGGKVQAQIQVARPSLSQC